MKIQEGFSFLIFGVFVALGFLSNYLNHRLLLKPLTIAEEGQLAGKFTAERAYENLKILAISVTGTAANEQLAVDFILEQLYSIKNKSVKPNDIKVDRQIVSTKRYYMTNYHLQNILAKVQGQENDALLLNCHFDSAPGSPGASDDSVMCCIMIEILRVLSQEEEKPKNSIIFLFNGAEEVGLQGSYAFVEKHSWASNVKTFINLESTGSDGRELLFRLGPNQEWLTRMYRESVPRPFGHVLAEDLFEANLIPASTDFSVFVNYAGYNGLDFAYTKNGWRYHTEYDSVDYISQESIQHTGENILALTKKIANYEGLPQSPEATSSVYFDFLGIFFISYPNKLGFILNITISVIAVVVPFLVQTKFKLSNLKFVFTETLISFLTMVLSTTFSGCVCYLIAFLMNEVDYTMSWYNTTILSLGIYASIAILVQIATYHGFQILCKKFIFDWQKSGKKYISNRLRLKVQLNGVNIFWAAVTITISVLDFKFGYLSMVLLLITFITNIVGYMMSKFIPVTTPQAWILLHLLGQSIAFLWLSGVALQALEVFIPTTGKVYFENPEIFIASIALLWTVLCFSFLIPLTNLVKARSVLYTSLLTIFSVSLILAFTPVGHPYSADKDNPRPQRFYLVHSLRNIYDTNGNLSSTENGYLITAIDRNSERTVTSSFADEKLINYKEDPLCETVAYCGFPFPPIMSELNVFYLGNSTIKPSMSSATFSVKKIQVDKSRIIVKCKITYADMTLFSITPAKGWKYIEGSLATLRSQFNELEFDEASIIMGLKMNRAMDHNFIFMKGDDADPEIAARIVVSTLKPVSEKSEQFLEPMAKLPKWASVVKLQSISSIHNIKAY